LQHGQNAQPTKSGLDGSVDSRSVEPSSTGASGRLGRSSIPTPTILAFSTRVCRQTWMGVCSKEKLIAARLQSTNGVAIPSASHARRSSPRESEAVRELRRNTFRARHCCREGIHRQGMNPKDVRFSLPKFFDLICVPRRRFRELHDNRLRDTQRPLSYRARFLPFCGLACIRSASRRRSPFFA
jgi:hypothetical protein